MLPPGFVWMRTAMRLALAGCMWLLGFSHLALVIAVLAFMPLVGFVEVQVAKQLAAFSKNKGRT